VQNLGVRDHRVIRWMAGLVVAALLVGGGVALGANLTASNAKPNTNLTLVSSASMRSVADGSLSSSSIKHDIAELHKCLSAARKLASHGHYAAARAELRACVRKHHLGGLLLLRRLLLVGGEYGQITYKTKLGSKTVGFERGLIQTVSSGSVVVDAADGTAFTWHLVSKTAVVRVKNHTIKPVSATALATGQRVFVVGAVVGGTDFARLIIIRG
jgi:hypothetical protein